MKVVWLTIWLGISVCGAAAGRSLTLRNSCPHVVRVGLTTGAVPNARCAQTTDCPATSTCNVAAGLCFYQSFLPSAPLDLSPKQIYNVSIAIAEGSMYSAALYVSTGCDSYDNTCETAICRNKSCDAFTGPVGPHTRAEFTFNPQGADFYDISLMHGINVPIAMMPRVSKPSNASDPYSCAAAGGVTASKDLPACGYVCDPYSVDGSDLITDIRFVAPSSLAALTHCQSDADCSSSERCGIAAGRDPTGLPTTEILKVCGKTVGMWSADEICIYSAGSFASAPYYCTKNAQHGPFTDLYACAGSYVHSGYQKDQDPAYVCGCYDWSMPSSSPCQSQNPEWMEISLPWTKLVKSTCPTAYSYAFDDMTSTFTCVGQRDLTYEIEFCPNGVTLSFLV